MLSFVWQEVKSSNMHQFHIHNKPVHLKFALLIQFPHFIIQQVIKWFNRQVRVCNWIWEINTVGLDCNLSCWVKIAHIEPFNQWQAITTNLQHNTTIKQHSRTVEKNKVVRKYLQRLFLRFFDSSEPQCEPLPLNGEDYSQKRPTCQSSPRASNDLWKRFLCLWKRFLGHWLRSIS